MIQFHNFYEMFMRIGKASGCHQLPSRSFYIKGKQFPICARCTGVLAGECIALFFFRYLSLPHIFLLIFCGVMFLDWFFQYMKIQNSNNTRRFITGCLGGYAYITLLLKIILQLKSL